MASNSSHSSKITLREVLSFDSVSEFLLYLIVSTSTLLTAVGPMLYKLIIEKYERHAIGIDKEFRKPHKIRIQERRLRRFDKNIIYKTPSFLQIKIQYFKYCTSAKKDAQYVKINNIFKIFFRFRRNLQRFLFFNK